MRILTIYVAIPLTPMTARDHRLQPLAVVLLSTDVLQLPGNDADDDRIELLALGMVIGIKERR